MLRQAGAASGAYREHFLGAGAPFLALCHAHRPAILTDANGELIDTYLAIRDMPEDVIAALLRHQAAFDEAAAEDARTPEGGGRFAAVYYALRAQDPATLPIHERAARLIALNKTCMNGLFRVNRAGRFNVPVGRHSDANGQRRVPRLCRATRIHAVSLALQGATIACRDGIAATAEAERGDFVYDDPPYADLATKKSFTAYTKAGFPWSEQVRLAEALRTADRRGARFGTSNHDTPAIRKLYAGYRFVPISAARAISAKTEGRVPVNEVLITNLW